MQKSIAALVPVGLKTPFGRLLLTDSDHPKFARAHPELTGAVASTISSLYTETMQWQCAIAVPGRGYNFCGYPDLLHVISHDCPASRR